MAAKPEDTSLYEYCLALFESVVAKGKDEREEIHKKTFRKWVNSKLAMAVPPLEITDLIEEVRDGHVLLSLLEVLLGTTLKREKGLMRVHKLNNVTTAFKLLEQNRVKIVGISNYDIVDGKSTPILGLIWSVILRFQVQNVMEESDSDSSVKDFQVEKKLLSWCQGALDGYDEVKLKDFTSSWRDGLAFNAIIHTHKPELFRFEDLLQNDNHTNLEHAFTMANEEFSVPKLLDPTDIDVHQPDKKLIIMYLTSLYHKLREYTPRGGRKRRKLDDLGELEAYRAAVKDINAYIAQVEKEVSSKLETTSRFANPKEEYKISKALEDNITNHGKDVADVIEKGDAVVKSGKADEIQCTEIKNEILLLHDRWQKLEILSQRLYKRCRGAVISPREQQIDAYIVWIKGIRSEMALRGHNDNPAQIEKEIREHEGSKAKIEQKQPEIEQFLEEVNDLCQQPFIDEDDRAELDLKLDDLRKNWEEARIEAVEKETNLQDKLEHPSATLSSPVQENVDTEVLEDNLQSAPSDLSVEVIEPVVEDVVETKPNVHYLIDFEDGPSIDQTDSVDKEAAKEAKLAELKEKRNAILHVLRDCSGKLENLRSIGAPNSLQGVKEQHDIVTECESELKAGEPLMQDAILYGRELTQDDLFDADEKEDITRDMVELQERYDELRTFIDDEQEGLLELKEELEKRNKIGDCEAKKDELNEKLDICQDKLRNVRDDKSPDIKVDDDLVAKAKACYEEVVSLEPEVKEVTDAGNNLIRTESLHGDPRATIQRDIMDINERYEELTKRSDEEVKRLEQLSSEEFERKAKLDKWQSIVEETLSLIKDNRAMLDEIKAKDPHTTPEVQVQIDEVQKLIDDVASSFPEVQSGYDYGNDLLKDRQISEQDKDKIEKDMDTIGPDFQLLQQEINDEHKRLNTLLSDALAEDEEKLTKMKKWKEWRDKLNSKYKKTRGKFNKVKGQGIAEQPKKVQEQLQLARECSSDIAESVPELQEAFNYANELIVDKDVEPADKEAIRKDVQEIGEGFKNLKLEINDFENELHNLSLKQQEDKAEKIQRWEIWIIRIRELKDKCQEKMRDLKSNSEPKNKKDVEEQIILADECKVELQSAKPVIEEGLVYGKQLLDDDVVDDDKKAEIKKDVDEVEYDIAKMEKDHADQRGRLEVLAAQYDSDKKNKLEKWETWKAKIRSILAFNQARLNDIKTEDADHGNVEEQLAKAKDCQDNLQNSEPEINFALECGEQLIDDDITDLEDKKKIKEEIQELEKALNDLKEDTAKERIRLEELRARQREEEKNQKLQKWENRKAYIRELMGNCEEKLVTLKSKGDPKDKDEAEELINLNNECKNELQKLKPEMTDCLAYGLQLLEDDNIDDGNKADVKQDLNQIDDDLSRLKDAASENERRLQDRLEALDNESTELMEDWHEKCNILKSGMDAADMKIAEGKKAEGIEELDNSYKMLQDLSKGLALMEPEMTSTLNHGKQLSLNESLSSDNRNEVSEDVKYLDDRWRALMKTAEEEYTRIGVQLGESQAKQSHLAIWHERCDELQEWVTDRYTRLRSRPTSPEASFGGIKRQQSVIEELMKDLVSKQGEVNEVIDEGNQIIEDKMLLDAERKIVHEKMVALHNDWNKLATLTSGKQQSVQVLLLEKEQQHLDKTQNWRRKIDPLMMWISSAETRLNTQFEIAPDLDTVKKQKRDLEEFNDDMLSHQREVSDTLVYGDKLLKDSELPEDDRTAIQKEVLDLSHRWENLEELVSWKSDRIDDTIMKLKIQQEDKLEKWHEGLTDINGWVMKTRVKVDAHVTLASDVDGALEQMDDFQEVIKDAPVYQEKVTHLNEFSDNLVTDPCLGEEERKVVRQETVVCNQKWNELVNIANAKQARMEDNLDRLERLEQDALERWRIRSERAGLALDKLEGQIAVIDDPIGDTLETIRRQEDAFEIFSNEVDLNTSHMLDTFALGEQVRKDPKVTLKKKEEVNEHFNSLVARWDRIKDFIALRNERLEEASKRLQRERRNKLHDWEERLTSVDSFLRKAERETERLEPVADDLETVRRQTEEFEHSMSLLLGPQKRVYDFGKFTDDLIADPVIDEKNKQTMASDKDNRLERWARVADKISKHRDKLQDKLSLLERSEGEVSRWNDDLATINEEVAKVEVICKQPILPNLEALDKQRKEARQLKEDVQRIDPQVDEFLKNSDALLDEDELSDNDHRTIEVESESLRDHWNKVKEEAKSRESRVEEEYLRSQKRQKELLDEWKNSCNLTLKWIGDTSARVDAQNTPAPDLDHARAQRQEIEDITKEIKQYDRQMDKLDQLGDKVVRDPSVSEQDKGVVKEDKESVIARWQELLSKTGAAKDRLDKQAAQLEKEQRDKLRVWSQKTEPLDVWLGKNETTVQSYEPIGYDMGYVKEQKEDAEAMITDLLREQPKFNDMTKFGNQLTTDPCVGLEERVRLQKEMQSLHQRWEGLYTSTISRHDRIKERLRILEEEQRKLEEEQKTLEEEEIQRRLEEERKRLEEKKRKEKEEEERKRREEEARLRRELEERQKREEEERLRREEEEKRRLAELERKRREEEERKRKEEEERLRKEEEEKKKRAEEERKRKEQEERRKKEEERRRKEEEERRKREEEDRRRKEEDERRRREQEERWEREEAERKRREEEKRKQREEEEERKRKEKEKKRKEEEERKRKEAEEKKKREEEEKLKAFTYISPEPHVQLVEQEPRLSGSSPVVDEVVVGVDEDVVDAGVDPGILQEKLDDWKKEAKDIDVWVKDQEDRLPESDDEDTIETMNAKDDKIKNLEKELPVYDKRYQDLEKGFEEIMNDNGYTEDQREAIGEEMDDLRVRWRSLNNNKDTKKNKLKDKIWDKEQKKAGELAGCRVNLQAVKNWVNLRNKELDSLEPIGNDLQTLARQKEDMKQLSQRLNDYEPRFTEATSTAYKLCKDPAFSNEQNKALRNDAEDCEKNWDDVVEKLKDRMDSIVKKIPKLQKNQQEVLEEWKGSSARFEKSLKKTEGKLQEQTAAGRELGYEEWLPESRSPELAQRQREGDNEWKPAVEEFNARLKSVREKLQHIQGEKKNRKWSILEALKDVMQSLTSRFKGSSKSGVNLDKLVDLLEDHEDIMTDTSSKQKDADEVFALGASGLNSGVLSNDQAIDLQEHMSDLNRRWNVLNIDVIQREKRLEKFAEDIESEYEKFDTWRDGCDNMNQWLTESEKLIKNEDKIGTNVDVLKEQITDNQLFLSEVKQYEPKVEAILKDSEDLVESSKLDKTDIDGVDKTKNALSTRWKAVNEHLNDRHQKLEAALLDILKKETEGKLGGWREQSIALGLLITEASRKVNEDVDETDYGDIQSSAVQLQQVEATIEDDLSRELIEVTEAGRHIIEKKELQPDEADGVNETLNALNRQMADLERDTRERKDRIKESSLKYFGRSLADCEHAVERLEDASANFSDVGSDISEVGQQLVEVQAFQSDLDKEEAKFGDVKQHFEDGKETDLLREEDKGRVQRRIGALDEKWAELNQIHNDNYRRLTQAMIVFHEELMEELYEWMDDAEKQAESIAVNEGDISSVMEEYGRHRELKEQISSFEPTFRRAMSVSERLLSEQLVDPERADSYETEISTLEKRWTRLQLKTMDNGAKLSGVLGRYITTRLDDAEVILTRAESSIDRDDGDYLDLEAAKKALDTFEPRREGVRDSQKKVSEILSESRAIVKEDFFREHERDHFRGRIEIIDQRSKALDNKVDKEEKRLLDTYLLLLKQNFQKMNIWLSMAESRIKTQGEIGPGYDDVKKQLEDHQTFQEELRDHSMISMILGVDATHPAISEGTHEQVKSLSDRWSKVWNWSEQRKAQLLKVLSNWQRFRDEQLILLNWLSEKEKTLKDMGRIDLTDEEEVNDHLEKLRVIEKELDEQGVRLQTLHQAGSDLLKNVNESDPASTEINSQLKDFDDCWNDIAKQVINRLQLLETSQNKLKEFHTEMGATNEWMDDTEKLLKSFSVGMDPEEASKLQEKTEIKCEERARYATKVDRINRLGKDLAGEIDQPSHDAIQEELEPLNARWNDVSIQLENFSDKGYPQPKNECCLIRIMRRKFGVFQ